ncbi:MAG: outer membrane lipoprotein-sorting protein [Gammaproteobacteria bacterium]|nr:outer membrane lipoprotein-sorting protein [Gammaproteobacteria bacterium]
MIRRAAWTPTARPASECTGGSPSRRANAVLHSLLVPILLFALGGADRSLAVESQGEAEAVALLRRAEQQLRPGASTSVYQVLIVRPDWERALRFRSHEDRTQDRFRLEVLDPVKTRGTVFLKVGRQLSMYLPKLRRTIAVSPVMMHDEWMGSDFNHQDLVEAGALIDQYAHRVVSRERTGGVETVLIESTPRADSTVVWESLRQRIRTDGIPVEVEYRGRDGVALRRMTFQDVREMGGRQVPTRWVMQPLDRAGQRTEIVLEEIQFEVAIPPSIFEVPAGTGPP